MTSMTDLSLQDLILTLKGDRTYAGLEEASGGVVKAQRWNQITNGIRVSEFPEPRTIEAMAVALNVGVDVLVFAFARAVGLDVQRNQSGFADLLPPMVNELTDRDQHAVLSVIRALGEAHRNANDNDGGDGGNTPPVQSPSRKKIRSDVPSI